MAQLQVDEADIQRMADKTLLSFGPNSGAKYSQFWVLLALAGVIATAGVVGDSTATVIGAMIVAPLMTPILGSAFAIVATRRWGRLGARARAGGPGGCVARLAGLRHPRLHRREADLIVLGTRGLSGMAAVRAGSIATTALARHAACSVLAARAD